MAFCGSTKLGFPPPKRYLAQQLADSNQPD